MNTGIENRWIKENFINNKMIIEKWKSEKYHKDQCIQTQNEEKREIKCKFLRGKFQSYCSIMAKPLAIKVSTQNKVILFGCSFGLNTFDVNENIQFIADINRVLYWAKYERIMNQFSFVSFVPQFVSITNVDKEKKQKNK